MRGKRLSKWSHAWRYYQADNQNHDHGHDRTTTSALLWLNLRNVCTFSAVTLYCFLVSVYLFTSFYSLVFVLFLVF